MEAPQGVKPSVIGFIASDPVGGPGKGLFQFLTNFPVGALDYTICDFAARWLPDEPYEFETVARALELPLIHIPQAWPIDPMVVARAVRIVRERGGNLLETHGYKPNLLGFFLRRILGRPWIAFAHGYTDDNRKIRLYNALDAIVLRFADRVVAVSHAMQDLLLLKGVPARKIQVIQNAVDENEVIPCRSPGEMRSSLGLEQRGPILGIVGRLSPEKGQRVFLEAFRVLLSAFPHALLLLIGDGQERQDMEAFCRTHGLEGHVRFTGYVPNVPDYYQLMDLLVIPSFSEGLPNVLLEAMVAGVPILATAVGGMPEVLSPDRGLLVSPGDVPGFAEAAKACLSDREATRERVKRARETVFLRFGPLERSQRILALYGALLRGHPHAAHGRSGGRRPSADQGGGT